MKDNRAVGFAKEFISIYLGRRASRSAAELSYFLTLSVFPTLICLYALLGNYIPTTNIINDILTGIIPTETLKTITEYLDYVSLHSSRSMLVGGLILMATSSAAAFRSLHNIMADILGEPRYRGLGFVLASFLFSLVFLVVMYLAAIIIITGEWFLNVMSRYTDISWAWSWLRFVILFAILLMLVLGVYRLTSPREMRGDLLPGAMLAAAAMVVVGMIFSAMVSYSVRYSLVYGSLASIIILMLWLYIFGNIIIMGNILNFLLKKYLA